MRYYAVESSKSSITASNWLAYACAQTAITPDAFATCACPAPPPDPGSANAPPR
jgi:hypothetical protein